MPKKINWLARRDRIRKFCTEMGDCAYSIVVAQHQLEEETNTVKQQKVLERRIERLTDSYYKAQDSLANMTGYLI